jgi:undecaprenyl-diphosphatase
MLEAVMLKITFFDQHILRWVFPYSQRKFCKPFMKTVSKTADGWLYPLAPLTLAFFHPQEGLRYFLLLLAGFALQLPAYLVLKRCIKRERPFRQMPSVLNLVQPADTFSFPSGHTAAATLFATISLLFFGPSAFWFLPWVLLVGMSRVFLGVHYVTDVVAGFLLGLCLGQGVMMVLF